MYVCICTNIWNCVYAYACMYVRFCIHTDAKFNVFVYILILHSLCVPSRDRRNCNCCRRMYANTCIYIKVCIQTHTYIFRHIYVHVNFNVHTCSGSQVMQPRPKQSLHDEIACMCYKCDMYCMCQVCAMTHSYGCVQ